MNQRDMLKKDAADTGDPEVYNEYKALRNEVTMRLRTAESDYFGSKFQDESINSKDLWGTAYQVLVKNISDFPSQNQF